LKREGNKQFKVARRRQRKRMRKRIRKKNTGRRNRRRGGGDLYGYQRRDRSRLNRKRRIWDKEKKELKYDED
jgi:hypothetical protein